MSTFYSDLTFTNFPNNVQTFVTMLNMVATDGGLVKNYQLAMQQGNLALAQIYYNQITNANQKFVDSTKLNTMMDTIVAVQRFYQTDVQPYITTKQAEWQGIIDRFNYQGVYSSTVQYQVNNFVQYTVNNAPLVYICTATPPISTVPTNTKYWRVLSLRGIQGAPGAGVAYRGNWSPTENYTVQDVVNYNNATWGCTQANTGNAPAEGSAYWNLIYSVAPTVYPFQADQPTSANLGDLWFEPLG